MTCSSSVRAVDQHFEPRGLTYGAFAYQVQETEGRPMYHRDVRRFRSPAERRRVLERERDQRIADADRRREEEQREQRRRLVEYEARRLASMTPEQIAVQQAELAGLYKQLAEERRRHQEWLDRRQAERRTSMTSGT